MHDNYVADKILKTERKLNELSVHIQRLNHEYQTLLDELALTPEELKAFVENPDNFSNWEQLQHEKREMDEKLNVELNSVIDANKTQKIFSERGQVQQHWMFVR